MEAEGELEVEGVVEESVDLLESADFLASDLVSDGEPSEAGDLLAEPPPLA